MEVPLAHPLYLSSLLKCWRLTTDSWPRLFANHYAHDLRVRNTSFIESTFINQEHRYNERVNGAHHGRAYQVKDDRPELLETKFLHQLLDEQKRDEDERASKIAGSQPLVDVRDDEDGELEEQQQKSEGSAKDWNVDSKGQGKAAVSDEEDEHKEQQQNSTSSAKDWNVDSKGKEKAAASEGGFN